MPVQSTSPISSTYSFLGDVLDYEQVDSRLILKCAGNHSLTIAFLQTNLFRVTLARPEVIDNLLEYPLVKTDWSSVPLSLKENDEFIELETAELELRIYKSPCRITVLDRDGRIINQDEPGLGVGWCGSEVKCWKTITDDEMFFGLGEKTGKLNKRGKEWVMWNTDDPYHDNHSDPLYQSIPFLIGVRNYDAYGIYFNNSYRSRFNLGAGNCRYFSFSAEGGSLDYFFIYGPAVARVVSTYSEITGRMPLPPKWALGYQQCRYSYYPDHEVQRIAQTFRDKEIPADVIYLDIHYMDGFRVFTWDKKRYPRPADLVNRLKEMGFKVVVIIDPGVKADKEYSIAQAGLEQGHFLKYPDGQHYIGEVWPGPAYFPDFSRSETREWWAGLVGGLIDVGIDGVWNDMNEPAVWGKAFPDEVIFHDEGNISSHKKFHNLYGFLMVKTCHEGIRELRPDKRPFIITRAGFAGVQHYSTVWTGDNKSVEESLGLGMRMLIGLGLSGVPFSGTDVGGFTGSPSKELYARWVQAACLTPYFRTHTEFNSPSQEPWSFGEEVEAICKKYISMRYRLLPYLYSIVWQASQNGSPFMRPLFWYDQNDPVTYVTAYQEQFFVGEKVLVAPVTSLGQSLKKIYLPAGRWLDPETGEVYQGSQTVAIDTPLDKLPLFWREGAIIPGNEVQQFVGERRPSELRLDVFPAIDESQFVLYEDDGESQEYAKGQYRLTQFRVRMDNDSLLLTKERLHDQYDTGSRQLKIQIHQVEMPGGQIRLGNDVLGEIGAGSGRKGGPPFDSAPFDSAQGGPFGYYYDNERKILVIQFEDEEREQSVMVEKIGIAD